MPKATPIQTNFTAGEISPRLEGRVDLAKYANGARTMLNMFVHPHGGASRRGGTKYINDAKSSTGTVLIPFEFSTTQAYMLEFSNNTIRFYKDYIRISSVPELITNGNFDSGLTSWTDASTGPSTVTWAAAYQAAYLDLVGPTTGVSNAILRQTVTGLTIGNSYTLSGVNVSHPASFRYNLRAGTTLGGTEYAEVTLTINTSGSAQFTATATTCYVELFLEGIYPSAVADSISLVDNDAALEVSTTYTESEIAEIQFVQSADTLYLLHKNHPPATLTRSSHTSWTLADISFTAQPAEWGAGNYPTTAAFFEQRLFFAGNPDNPQTIWGSKSGDFTDMTTGTAADDAVSYTISTDKVNKIQWLSPGKTLIIGTAGGEFVVSASSLEEAITPTNIRIVRQSTFGSAEQSPVRISDLTIFVQRAKRKIREFVYNFSSDSYSGPDLTIISEHITAAGVRKIVYQQEPDSIVWCLREDGILVGLTYQRDQEVVGWHRHVIAGASTAIVSIATIPSPLGDADDLWLVVSRTIDGTTVQHIEVLSAPLSATADVDDSFYVDSGLEYNGVATSTLSGLGHLEGETVSILAGGSVRPDEVVSSGAITVDGPEFTRAVVGLAYNSDLETLRFEAGSADGTAQGKVKRISKATIRLHRTVGLLVGPDADNLDRVPFRSSADAMDDPVALFSGDKDISFPAGWNKDGRVFIRQNQPLPMTVLAVMPRIKTNN